MRGCRRFIGGVGVGGIALRLRCVEQLAGSRDVVGAPGAGEQAVVADAVEAVRQDVDEEAADELACGEGHHLGPLAALGAIVLPLEGDALAVERDEAAVGDGDAVGVAGEVGQNRLGSSERTLAVDDPFAFA